MIAFISDKIDFKSKTVLTQTSLHNDKRANSTEKKTVMNVYVLNIRAHKYIK